MGDGFGGCRDSELVGLAFVGYQKFHGLFGNETG